MGEAGEKGFTLIELLVTITIIAILASVILPLSEMAVKREKEIELKRSLRIIRTAIDEYKRASDEGLILKKAGESGYPPDLESLVEGVTLVKIIRSTDADGDGDDGPKVIRFLRRIPKDPMEPSPYIAPEDTWNIRSYDSDFDNPSEGDDVFDVYSLSEEIALDGTTYSSW